MRDENSRLKQIVIECEYQLEQSRRQLAEAETNAEQVSISTTSSESLPALTARTFLTANLTVTKLRLFATLIFNGPGSHNILHFAGAEEGQSCWATEQNRPNAACRQAFLSPGTRSELWVCSFPRGETPAWNEDGHADLFANIS
jgi:hypothetical protein